MAVTLCSLAVIMLIAVVCPVVAQLIPGRAIPETVFLIACGAILGPNLLGAIQLTEPVTVLSELGLSFLFLLAGYEIDPQIILGHQGKRGLAAWAVSFVVAIGVAFISIGSGETLAFWAVAIALTTTALGTLMPILKERQLMGTPVGDAVLAYGTWGELAPVLAMAILLSSRSGWQTALILLAFAAVAVTLAVIPAKARAAGSRFILYLERNRSAGSQPVLRLVILLMVVLVALAELFELDIVLGAFAAGFVLRYIIPEGDHLLEEKIEAVANGFFIPLFFVVSGAKIQLSAVGQAPLLLIGFIIMLLLVRAIPIHVSLILDREHTGLTAWSEQSVALYCTTALPLVVAVTSVTVNAGAMSQSTASVLVCAGAVTVFLMPFLAQLCGSIVDAHPVDAVHEIIKNPDDTRAILSDHVALSRMHGAQRDLREAHLAHIARLEEAARLGDVSGIGNLADRHEEARNKALDKAERRMEEREQALSRRLKARAADAAHAEEVAQRFAEERKRRMEELRRR